MGDSYSNLLSHIIFSTKNREPLITADLQARLYPYMGGIAREIGATLLTVGGIEDHVHLLIKIPPRLAPADVVRLIKANSSKWVHEELERRFGWQSGYAVFSVSESVAGEVREYIANQHEHHRTMTFQEEYRKFLVRHGIEFDERYIWD
jgi:putative transposase